MKIDLCKLFNVEEGEEFKFDGYVDIYFIKNGYLYFGYILAEGEVYEFETTKFDVENINQAKIKVQDELIKLIELGVIQEDSYIKRDCHVIAFEEIS